MAAQTSGPARDLSGAASLPARLAGQAGVWLRDHQRAIRRLQWIIILAYAALLFAPMLAPVPTRLSHIWSNATLFAQFAFWGLWWPFVLVSMVLLGRSWCGILCPEGALAEFASNRGLGRATPRWIKWKGWPFAAFAGTTIYGQMVSVYQYPKPVIIVLGGSTLAAMITGFLYGRDKRVWCRYLCPVNGVFGLLAKLAPVHFRVDRDIWERWSATHEGPPGPVNCAPLVPIRTMRGGSACHMCGRCAGFKDAVTLAPRAPSQEVVSVAGDEPRPWETALIAFGLMGLAAGAFEWTQSPLYVAAKQFMAEWLVNRGWIWPIEPHLPWWILTNYPDQNDMMTPLDGGLMIAYVLAAATLTGTAVYGCLALATRALGGWEARRFHHLAQGLIPIAGCGVFLGLSAITVSQLRAEGLALHWVSDARAMLLAGAALWSLGLIWGISGRHADTGGARLFCLAGGALAVACGLVHWIMLFWIW